MRVMGHLGLLVGLLPTIDAGTVESKIVGLSLLLLTLGMSRTASFFLRWGWWAGVAASAAWAVLSVASAFFCALTFST